MVIIDHIIINPVKVNIVPIILRVRMVKTALQVVNKTDLTLIIILVLQGQIRMERQLQDHIMEPILQDHITEQILEDLIKQDLLLEDQIKLVQDLLPEDHIRQETLLEDQIRAAHPLEDHIIIRIRKAVAGLVKQVVTIIKTEQDNKAVIAAAEVAVVPLVDIRIEVMVLEPAVITEAVMILGQRIQKN
jgi:hypothetical protein